MTQVHAQALLLAQYAMAQRGTMVILGLHPALIVGVEELVLVDYVQLTKLANNMRRNYKKTALIMLRAVLGHIPLPALVAILAAAPTLPVAPVAVPEFAQVAMASEDITLIPALIPDMTPECGKTVRLAAAVDDALTATAAGVIDAIIDSRIRLDLLKGLSNRMIYGFSKLIGAT